MPSFSGLFARAPEGPLRIPVDSTVALGFAVYYVPGYPPLGGAELRVALPAWLAENMAEPLRGAVTQFAAGEGLLYTDDLQRGAVPLPPYDLLRSEGASEEELKRLEKGYQLVIVSARDENRVPRFGLWTALAGAMAAADALNGVAYDPARMSVIAPDSPPLAGDGVVRVREHVALRVAETTSGGLVTTAGMSKLGIPELRVGFARGLQAPTTLLADVAQQLADAVVQANHGRDACLDEVEFGPDLTANGVPLAVRYTAGEPGQKGWVDVGAGGLAG